MKCDVVAMGMYQVLEGYIAQRRDSARSVRYGWDPVY